MADPRDADATAGAALGVATVATGMMAGVFGVFDVAVMPALGKAEDQDFVTTMRRINSTIENPVFGLAYVGALAAPAAAAVLLHRAGHKRAARWAAGALAFYGAAVAITSAVNLPLNARLARTADPAEARQAFERRWNAANVARTVVSTAAVACLARAVTIVRRPSERTDA